MRKSNIDITGVNLYDSIQRKPQKTEDTFRRYPTNVRNKSLFILFFFIKVIVSTELPCSFPIPVRMLAWTKASQAQVSIVTRSSTSRPVNFYKIIANEARPSTFIHRVLLLPCSLCRAWKPGDNLLLFLSDPLPLARLPARTNMATFQFPPLGSCVAVRNRAVVAVYADGGRGGRSDYSFPPFYRYK